MIYQISLLSFIALAIVYPNSGGGIALASVMAFFASMFYILTFNAMTGQKEVGLDLDTNAHHIWQNRIISIAATVALYKVGMTEVFYYILPFQIIGFSCDALVTGIKMHILEVEEVDIDDEE